MNTSHQLTVYESKDFDIFQTLPGNRELSVVQIRKLAKNLEKNPGFTKLSPILVNEKMQVIDGQHRLAAYKKFQEEHDTAHPIYFITVKGLGIEEARSLNAGSKPWSPRDYAVAYSNSGNTQYATYLKYVKETGLNHDILVRYLAPINYGLPNFRDGGFVVENEKLSQMWLNNLEEVGLVIRESMPEPIDWKHRSFAIGLLSVMLSPHYDQERMLEQLESHSRILRVTDMRNVDISLALQRIYNKGQEDKVTLLDY